MSRASSAVLGTFLLVGLAVALSAALGSIAFGLPQPSTATAVAVSVEANAVDGRIAIVHEAGPPLRVTELRLRIEIDGVPLEKQPPVPFYSAFGFHSFPTGPFNAAADPVWEPGVRASLRIASTNTPQLTEGATVSVELFRDGLPVASAETTAR